MGIKCFLSYLFLSVCAFCLQGQSVYFVDGYHGGVYGHYPLWNTQFYVDKLAKYPEWQICLEIEPETWEVARQKTPEAYRAFQQIAASSRVEFVNPTLAQPYMYNISGESIIRQMEHGMDMIHSHFPAVSFTTYSVEEPCFTSCLPQILTSFGFKYAVLKCPNTCWGGYSAPYGGELVNWIGPDGTSILTVPRYACEALGKDVWYTTAANNSDEYLAATFAAGIQHPVGMCFQDAGWKNGPWLGSGNSIKNKSIYQTWRNYFENVTDGQTDDDWHFTQEDVLPGLMWGSQVLQKLSQEVRRSENNLVKAEKVNAMNYLLGGAPVADSLLRKAWYGLALSQHHDCWIVPYNGLKPGKTWAQMVTEWTNQTNRITEQIVNSALPNAELPTSVLITNTTAYSREELVEVAFPLAYAWENRILTDEQGRIVPFFVTEKEGKAVFQFMARTPAFGYAVYHVKKVTEAQVKVANKMVNVCNAYYEGGSDFIIENDLYKIAFDLSKGGIISSLIGKKMNRKEFIDQKSGVGFGELRGHFYDEEQFRSSTEKRAQITVLEKTPGKVTVEIKSEIAGHPVSQVITLQQGDSKINGRLRIDWQGNPGIGEFRAKDTWNLNHRPSYNDRYKLQLMFPAAIGEQQQVYKNAPFDVCKSRLENTYYSTWDSIKHNVVLNWVDFSGKDNQYGLAVLTDHTTSYTHGGGLPPGLTIQYSGMGLWGKDYVISGPTQIDYALIPHTGAWDKRGLWTQSVEWNEPLLVETFAGEVPEVGKSLLSLSKKGYEITTVEVKEGALYVRLFNAEANDKPVVLDFGFTPRAIEEVELNGVVIKSLPVQSKKGRYTIETAMPRFGIKTFKIKI